ncbi:MAG: hypothetical protein CMD06_00895 [Flavobacteriales bacterium]|nr:hypothetical protein [Flavobacteriales bacterium]
MKILLIAYPSLKKDPRPFRQISLLHRDNYLHTVGGGPSGLEDEFTLLKKNNFLIELFRLILLKLNLYLRYNFDIHKKKVLKKLVNYHFDLVIVHEVRLLPLALSIAKKSPVILDAHEYSPKNFDDNFLWRFFIKKYYTFLCEKYIPKVNKIITVSPGIVNAYKKEFKKETFLITNACKFYENLQPRKINTSKIKLIHHGIANSSRKLELLIEMMKYLDNKLYELTFMLTNTSMSKMYLEKLKFASRKLNIRFIPPVKREDLVDFTNNYDIGIHFIPPSNFNLKYGLGNKFFEFIQSRIAIAIGPDIEMSKYVKKYDLGIISSSWSPKSLADKISETSIDKLNYYKNQTHKYAQTLSSKDNNEFFIDLINKYKR